MSEVRYEGLLESYCSANVMGKEWKDAFFEDKPNTDKKGVRVLDGGTGFKFGGESIVHSLGKYVFACCIAGEKTTITADFVGRDIPVLISEAEMTKRGFKLNLEDDSLEVKGRGIDLDTTEKGHITKFH